MKKAQREVFIEELYNRIENKNIFFITADLGSIQLDKIRKDFKDRFFNVGIAEQNLVNLSFGLALEGFTVFVYAISAFLTMRAFEQIRNLSINIQNRENININLLGVGAGLSYDLSGPSHSCLEDLSIMRSLPNIEIISPSDLVITKNFVDYSLNNTGLKYLRFDGKPVKSIYDENVNIDLEDGFYELKNGDRICLISTGIMTHKALNVANKLDNSKIVNHNVINIGLIDVFKLRPINEKLLYDRIKFYKHIITISEEFVDKGGLDSLISSILTKNYSDAKLTRLGFKDKYIFEIGNREQLHKSAGLDEDSIERMVIEKYNLC